MSPRRPRDLLYGDVIFGVSHSILFIDGLDSRYSEPVWSNCRPENVHKWESSHVHCEVAQSVERRTLEVEVQGSKPALGTWCWGKIPPNQPYLKGAAPAATTLLAEW